MDENKVSFEKLGLHLKFPFYLVDAFTSKKFSGNPAGVVILEEPICETQMQLLAMEFGYSETAFVTRNKSNFDIRWFTPKVEAPLCGHASLAAAHVLWTEGYESKSELTFASPSGPLLATRKLGKIELDFPTEPMTKLEVVPEILRKEFGFKIKTCGMNRLDYVLELDSEISVETYIPNFERLAQLGRGLIITSRTFQEGIDFVTRVFAPSEGIPEDPVTGSAHCCLAPFWAQQLNKNELYAKQLSKRGGSIEIVYRGERTILSGQAVTILSGELR